VTSPLGWILGLLIAGGFSFLAAHYYFKKQQKLKDKYSQKIETDIYQNIGDIRGRQPIIFQGKQTVYIGPQTISVAKKEERFASLLPKKRQKEIEAIEFAILRDAVEKEFREIEWLNRGFKRALLLAISALSSQQRTEKEMETKIEGEKETRKIKLEVPLELRGYFEDIKGLYDNDRLNHLIIPEIRRLDSAEGDEDYKWSILEDYFYNVKRNLQGNLIFIGDKDAHDYVTKLKKEHIEIRNVDSVTLEARGRWTERAVEVASVFLKETPSWGIKRVDFAMHKFEELKAGKLWIELWDIGYDKTLPEQKKAFLLKLAEGTNIEITTLPHEISHHGRHELYKSFSDILIDKGHLVLSANSGCITSLVFIAAAFRYHNLQYDYYCDIQLENDVPVLYVVFSEKSIVEMFDDFVDSSV
jgi:DNA-binding protein/predicted outer membrane lipoprotein